MCSNQATWLFIAGVALEIMRSTPLMNTLKLRTFVNTAGA
jgi:hypothetical protein